MDRRGPNTKQPFDITNAASHMPTQQNTTQQTTTKHSAAINKQDIDNNNNEMPFSVLFAMHFCISPLNNNKQ